MSQLSDSVDEAWSSAEGAVRVLALGVGLVVLGLGGCRDVATPPPVVALGAIVIDEGPRAVELGTRDTITATALAPNGDTVDVPFVWRSSNERVAVFERGGILVALDTGVTIVTATSLGVTSQPVGFAVVWLGPAIIDSMPYSPPHAVSPGAQLTDSVRVRVLNINEAPVANAKVAFRVLEGAGSVKPTTATTDANGLAAAQWTIGPDVGANTIVASVVQDDGTPHPYVEENEVRITITAYRALIVVDGDNQTGQILSELSQPPSVRLVDSTGSPRPGVPVRFTPFFGGIVTASVVSTNANGVATPGKWQLGDMPGEQWLDARVADATVRLRATGTGTPIHYTPTFIAAGGYSSCALEGSGAIKCWGEIPRVGTGDTANVSQPTPVDAALTATDVSGGGTHFCALTGQGAIWCWGFNAFVDTSGTIVDVDVPTRLPSDIVWSNVSAGFAHNCAITASNAAYCWGRNAEGQLGDATTATRFRPTPVAGGFVFAHIAGGSAHTCALSTGGSAFCWGANDFGQLGDATTQRRTVPTAVTGGNVFQAIGAGEAMSCGLRTDGRVACWGRLSTNARSTPVTYDQVPVFTSLTVGGGHACALTADGTAYCWGANDWGQVGDSSTTHRDAPMPVAGALRFSRVSAGLQHTCGLTVEGAVACWGRNRGGELGTATAAFFDVPRYLVLGVTP